jgi:peptide/nickel transport system substrate-binding protein
MRKTLLVLAIAALAASTAMTPAVMAQARTDVKIGLVLEPPSLDPTAEAAAAVDEVVYANIFEGLTRFAPDGTVIPALARSWDISEDGLTYTFTLAEGVKFHDGSDFNADDVKFSLERINAEGSLNAQKALYADIASVEVVDPATVKVTLSKPNGDFIYNLAWGDAVIVAPETAEANKTNPVGTGPFVFSNRIEGDSIVLAKNPDYWGTPIKLEGATFRFIADPTAAFGAMQAGDVDSFPNFPALDTIAQFQNDPRFSVVVGSTQGETILAMNNGKAPLDNVTVRQAIAHAINRDDIINGAMSGFGIPIGTFFPPGDANYVDLTAQSNFDPEKSKALLAEAGITDLTLSLKLPPVEGYARRGGEIIAQQLAAVGIKTETTNLEWAQWLDEVFKQKNYDLTIISHTEPNDISIFSRPDYYFDYQSEAFNSIIADIAVTADPDKRSELLKAAQQQLADDYAVGFLFGLAKVGVNNAKLKGLWENAPAQATDLTAVYWDE